MIKRVCALILLLMSVVVLSTSLYLIYCKELKHKKTVGKMAVHKLVTSEMVLNAIQNPGCVTKDLNKYTAVNVGKVYHHPPIVHYAKFGNTTLELNFREYVSVLSVYKFVKPEKIIFHTYPKGLSGKYWEKIGKWKNITIEVNKITPIHTIQGKKVKWVEHVADYVKLNMVLKHGGLALDFDVVIVNGSRLKYLQRLSECVLVGELTYINGGFYSCIKNSSFVARWLESYHNDYQPLKWIHNISYRPLHLLTSNQQTCYNVHVDNTVCVDPLWPKRSLWLKEGGVKWQSKMAAHYYVKKRIPHDGEGLLKGNFSLAEMITYVHSV